METKQEDGKHDDKNCCAKGGCGCKALKVIALLLIGGLGGYCAGKRCHTAAPTASAIVQPK